MKFRTDFVTNSSSSSFVAVLEVSLENGKRLRLIDDSRNYGEASGTIVVKRSNYKMDIDELLHEAYGKSLCDIAVEYDGECSRIKSGVLYLKCHTYGEFIVDACPESIFSRYAIGNPYSRVKSYLEENPGKRDKKLVSIMKQDRELEMLTEDSIRQLMEYCYTDVEVESDTEVMQIFDEDGTETISIENGGWLFDINDDFLYSNKVPDKYVSFSVKYNSEAYLKKCEKRANYAENTESLINQKSMDILISGKEYLYRLINPDDKGRISLIRSLTYDNLPKVRKTIDNAYHTDSIFEDIQYRKSLLDCLADNIDLQANISFADKHFVTTGFGDDEGLAAEQIIKRGGFFHKSLVKVTDYLIVDILNYGASKVQKALELRDQGSNIQIITSAQFEKTLFDKSIHVLSEEELQALKEAREKKKQLEAQEKKEVKEREAHLREQARAEKRKEAQLRRQEATEARARRAQERAEWAEAKRRAEREIMEKKAEARRQREAEKTEAERLAQEVRIKKHEEMEQARANAVILYAPGEEPEPLRTNIKNFMAKLDGAYPDHVIVNIAKDHRHWDERITELYRRLGYADRASFLEAYGFKVNSDKGGRPKTVDPEAVIAELKRRYPDGTDLNTAGLIAANKDLPVKTLSNNAPALFGMGLGRYLKEQGILLEKKQEAGHRNKQKPLEKEAIALEMERLKQEAQELAEQRSKQEKE